MPEVGQLYQPEKIKAVTNALRSKLIDSTKTLTPETLAQATQLAHDLIDPATKIEKAAAINALLDRSPLGLGLLKMELRRISIKAAMTGDTHLVDLLYDHDRDFTTLAEASGSGEQGAALRALADKDPVSNALFKIFTDARRAAAQKGSGITNKEVWQKIVADLSDFKLDPQEVEEAFNKPDEKVGDTGKTLTELLDENTPESKEAGSILDKYQRSQTEWLKPEAKKNIVRVIVDAAIGENKLARYDSEDFKQRLSQRLQEVTVPKEIADELAHEVWKDKATREATKTDRALKADANFEQSRAQAILDKFQSDQTEQFGTRRKSQAAEIVKNFLKQPEMTDESRAAGVAKLERDLIDSGVKDKTAKELAYEAGQRKRVLEANERLEQDKVTTSEAQKVADAKLKQLQDRHDGAEWLKPTGAVEAVRKIIADALKIGDGSAPVDANTLGNATETARKLMDAGVDSATAQKLGLEIEKERQTMFANRRTKQMERAANSGNIKSLIESILTAPYHSLSDTDWVKKISEDWFKSNGLAPEQAAAATRMFQEKVSAAIENARKKIAESVLSKVDTTNTKDLMKVILSGPDWLDKLAEKNGWTKPTPEQFNKLAELQKKWSDPALSNPEKADAMEHIYGILRHLGTNDKTFLQALGESQAASLLSGFNTLTLHIFQPFTSILFKDLPVVALTRPQDLPTVLKGFVTAAKNWLPEFRYAWQHDAYGFSVDKMTGYHNELKRQFEVGIQEWKNGNYKGALRMIYGWQQYVFRALQSANQAGMAVKRETSLMVYGSRAMRDAGLNTGQIGKLASAMVDLKNSIYEDGINRGLDADTASVRADALAAEQIGNFFDNKLDDTAWGKIVRASENDAYSLTGFKAPGIKESDEGFLSNMLPINSFMQFVQQMREKGGVQSVFGITAFGFVNVPLRVARFSANYSPYGLFRYGIYKYKTAGVTLNGKTYGGGQETPWKQSYATDLQARQRLAEAVIGSSLMALLYYATHGSTSADDQTKKAFFLNVTGNGPTNKTLRDAWMKDGYRPRSIIIGLNGSVVGAIPITRAGSVLAWLGGLSAAQDDHAWAVKEAQANGRKVDDSVSAELAQMAGTYYEIIGAQGIFQGISHLQQLSQTGGGMGKVLASSAAGLVSSVVLPGKQLLSSVSQMIWGNPDRSSISAAIAANFPIIGAPWLHPQINRLGDQLGDDSWYGTLAQTGIPIAFRVSDNQPNQALYQMLLDKGIAPPNLSRTQLEERYGPLTDDQFTQIAKQSGAAIKQNLLANLTDIQSMTNAEAKQFIFKTATATDNQVAQSLGLYPSAPTKSTASASGAATPSPSRQGKLSTTLPSVQKVLAHHNAVPKPKYHSVIRRSHHKPSSFSQRTRSLYGLNTRSLYGV